MEKKTVVYDHIEETVDHNTGEITQSTKKQIVKRDKTPDFLMLYTEGVDNIIGAGLSQGQVKVLFGLLESYVLPSNMLIINKDVKTNIADKIGSTLSSVSKSIQVLVQKGIIKKSGVSYHLDPFLFGKGNWNDIKKLRYESVTEFDFEKKEATTQKSTSTQYQDIDKNNVKVVDAKETITGDNNQHTEQQIVIEDKTQDEDTDTPSFPELMPESNDEMDKKRMELSMFLGDVVESMDDKQVIKALSNMANSLSS
jgi:DNA-binding Lrp family transcriptional regulator